MDDKKSKTWVRLLLSTLREEGCTKSAAVLLAVVADRATDSSTRSCRAAQKELAAAAGVDVRTVRRATEQLERLGLIEVERISGSESLYKLTAAVELPAKKRTTEQQRAAAQARAAAAARAREEAEYESECMALVNRFKEDDVHERS